ncbi:MFS transporter [Sulfobacillus harzensis]|uniref:MFS transporter n=1 Tax=Sulfobacillus harzensis TaxID=2729629 RepID=UPI0030843144
MSSTTHDQTLTPARLWVMAIMAGVTVANLYYNQPLLNMMASTYGQPHAALGWVTMLTQFGYALGLLLFVPLADFVEGRRLVSQLLIAAFLALILVSVSPTLWWLEAASLATGLFSVVPQVLLPMGANMADNRSRGRVVGIIMSGLLVGVLLARTFSGFIGGTGGWRLVFEMAALMMLIMLLVTRLALPPHPPRQARQKTRDVLRSLFPLIKEEPELLRVALTGASFFAAFSAFWTTLTFRLAEAPYYYHATTIGLFGLAGVAGALAAPVAGRRADQKDPRALVSLALALAVLVFILVAFFSASLVVIMVAVVLLDLATNSAQISNQSRIYALKPAARARSNTIYMVSYFVGGALGSGVGSLAFHWHKMPAVAAFAIVFLVLGALVHRWSLRRYARPEALNPLQLADEIGRKTSQQEADSTE